MRHWLRAGHSPDGARPTRRPRHSPTARVATVLAAGCLVLLASCGDDDGPTTAERPDTTPTAEVLGTGQTPQPTPPPAPTPTPPPSSPGGVHVVAEGELLSTIAAQYGVTLDALVAANAIADPNLVFVGQELVIPTG